MDSSEPFNLPFNPGLRAPIPECDNSILKARQEMQFSASTGIFADPFPREASKEFLITIEIEITQDTKSRAADWMQRLPPGVF